MPAIDPATEAVMKADHLSEETRRVYSSKLGIIAQAAGNRPLLKVLTQYPNKVIQYIKAKYNEVASQQLTMPPGPWLRTTTTSRPSTAF